MRALAYFRIGKGPAVSFQELEEAFLDYCDINAHQPLQVFVDQVEDPAQGPFPQFQRMVEYIRESGGQYLIVVPDASHLGPDLEAVARVVVEMETAGSKIACMDEELPDPLQNALQVLGVRGVSRERSRRIREAMRARALEGQALGRPPYGYRIGRDGTLEIVKAEAAVVELIYRLYTQEGLGLRLIAQELNDRGITTRRGNRWNMVSIRDILRNPVYMGTYTRFGMRLPKAHPPIVPAKVFRQAQDLLRARRPSGRVAVAEPFLLSGLAYCAYCGNKMMGVTRHQVWRRKDGRRARGVYRYYQCQSRNNQSVCGYHTWQAARLEGAVLSQLRWALQVKARDGEVASATLSRNDVRALREARLRNAERRFLRAMKRAARGEITVETLGEYLRELDTIRRGASRERVAADALEALDRWDQMDFVARQEFLMEHIVRVIVRDDAVEVVV